MTVPFFPRRCTGHQQLSVYPDSPYDRHRPGLRDRRRGSTDAQHCRQVSRGISGIGHRLNARLAFRTVAADPVGGMHPCARTGHRRFLPCMILEDSRCNGKHHRYEAPYFPMRFGAGMGSPGRKLRLRTRQTKLELVRGELARYLLRERKGTVPFFPGGEKR